MQTTLRISARSAPFLGVVRACSGKRRAFGRRTQQAGDVRCERVHIAFADQRAVRAAQHRGGAHHRRRDDRCTAGHRFDQHEPLRLGTRRKHEDIGGAVAVERAWCIDRDCRENARACRVRAIGSNGRSRGASGPSPAITKTKSSNSRFRIRATSSRKSMFFSIASRLTVSSIGCASPMPCARRKRAASAVREFLQTNAGRNDRRRRADPIPAQNLGHLRCRHDQVIDALAEPARKSPHEKPQHRRRKPRQIVGDVFLEIGVVALDGRATGFSRERRRRSGAPETACGYG